MKILIADRHFLSRTGLEQIIQTHFSNAMYMNFNGEGFKPLSQHIKKFLPDIVLLDYVSVNISPEELHTLMIKFPEVKFVLITEWLSRTELLKYFRNGIKWHLLKECDEYEIKECMEYAYNNQSFFCNKLIHFIQSGEDSLQLKDRNNIDCNGISITQREKEIIQLIAEGLSNKQIASALNLSVHTVLTHRKNIMKKTNANNTAGLVLFAIKNHIVPPSNHFLFEENQKTAVRI